MTRPARERRRDPVATHNERVKLLSGFLNALGLGLIGFGVLRPLFAAPERASVVMVLWVVTGLVFHLAAHYFLRYLEEGDGQ